MSLVSSLSAALAATLVQQWAKAHLRPFQRQESLLKTLWIQIVLSEGIDRLQMVAGAVPGFIHFSLILFFLGLGNAILNISTIAGVATVVPIAICGVYYFYSMVISITHPQWPSQNPLSYKIWGLIRVLHLALYNKISRGRHAKPGQIEGCQEPLAAKLTMATHPRDVGAVQWLIDKMNESNEMETFVLAIPGTFDQEWSRDTWKAVVTEAQLTLPVDVQVKHSTDVSQLQEGHSIFGLCTRVGQLFEFYNNETDGNEAARKRMYACVETVACLVCCADVSLSWFGEVGGVLSEVGYNERIKEPLKIRSNSSFAVRWTCLSLVSIRRMVMAEGNRIGEFAGFAVSGMARVQLDYGVPDAAAFDGAEMIDEYLETAWGHIEDLYRAFEPWDKIRDGDEVRNVLGGCELQLSELERIGNEAKGIDDVDWRISLLQDAMDAATHKLMRRLPGVTYDEIRQSRPILVTEAFDIPLFGSTPITPQFIFPGQHLRPLLALGRGLRNILEGRNIEKHKETLENLEAVGKVPIPLRRLNHLMKRQLWRLQDLRDGGGLGFTVELFFLALRQLSFASLSRESKRGFYICTFKVITSHCMDHKYSSGTQGILLDLLCDLVIHGRGLFSDFLYPAYIVDEFLELVRKMVDGHGGSHTHINDAVQELRNVSSMECADEGLRDSALRAIISQNFALVS
jgi:hypothetical protein